MESKAKILGHPAHTQLIVFPLGLLATAAIFDIIYLITNDGKWTEIAFWMIAAGLIGGVIAALAGVIDWLAIPDKTRAKRIGAIHGLGNLVVIGLFAISWFLRADVPTAPETLALVLSFAGVVLALGTGWLGGELVDRLGVGVDAGANINAPNSLSGRPADDSTTSPVRSPRLDT